MWALVVVRRTITTNRSTSNPTSGGLMTAQDVADMLTIPISWVYRASREDEIPTVKIGRYRRFRREAVEAWIVEQESN
jgi:excisionase family DNA binding protein